MRADHPPTDEPGSRGGDDASGSGAPTTEAPEAVEVTEVVDVAAVARLLHVGRNTVYALVARNEIPHRRLGKQIRFHRETVMRWLASWSWQGAKERQ
jgi:excisionase family DNA binding protein